MHVSLTIQVEHFTAVSARELYPGMLVLMFNPLLLFNEAFLAINTGKWVVPGVFSLVSFQCFVTGKSLGTQLTWVGSAFMFSHVVFIIRYILISLLTFLTPEFIVTQVGPHVTF